MIWGLGTERCGTLSLARALGGEHENQPYLTWQAAAWASGEDLSGELRPILEQRLRSGRPAWVDFKQSYCVELIREIDADATFIWVVRDPVLTVASYLQSHHWRGEDKTATWLLGADNWRAQPRLATILSMWKRTVERLLGEADIQVVHCEDLPVHTNHHVRPDRPAYGAGEEAFVRAETADLWNETLRRVSPCERFGRRGGGEHGT